MSRGEKVKEPTGIVQSFCKNLLSFAKLYCNIFCHRNLNHEYKNFAELSGGTNIKILGGSGGARENPRLEEKCPLKNHCQGMPSLSLSLQK